MLITTIEEIKTKSLDSKISLQKCFEDWNKPWHKCNISDGDIIKIDQ